MKSPVVFGAIMGVSTFLGGCSAPQFQTLTILDTPNRVVALQAIPGAYRGQGYDHPVSITKETMIRIMQGVRIERRGLYRSSSSFGSQSHPAFSESEIQFFAPLIVQGLSQATPEELVSFFETAEIETGELESDFQLTTSGGFYVAGGNLHVFLSNFSVKTPLWQDNEYYEASFRSRPLEQMEPQPGRLLYEPGEMMVTAPDGEIGSTVKGKPWQMAIRLKDFLETQEHVSEKK